MLSRKEASSSCNDNKLARSKVETKRFYAWLYINFATLFQPALCFHFQIYNVYLCQNNRQEVQLSIMKAIIEHKELV